VSPHQISQPQTQRNDSTDIKQKAEENFRMAPILQKQATSKKLRIFLSSSLPRITEGYNPEHHWDRSGLISAPSAMV
jgi:hypothetical protein